MSGPTPRAWDLLAGLLAYPKAGYAGRVAASLPPLVEWCPRAEPALRAFAAFVASHAETDLEERYTRTFDVNPTCALEIGWHLFGEQYERGAFMVDMRVQLRRHGIPESTELPDHLVHALPLAGRLAADEAAAFATDGLLPALAKMRAPFADGENPYGRLLEAIETAVVVKLAPQEARRRACSRCDGCGRRQRLAPPHRRTPGGGSLMASPTVFFAAAFPQLDLFLLAVLPYLAIALFLVVSIARYRGRPFTYSSLSSQFLENRKHFWGLVPFHYGLLIVLTGHLVAFLVPSAIIAWNGDPLRLLILEVSALACGLLTLVGLVLSIWRRFSGKSLRVVSSPLDWVLLAILLFQITGGVDLALRHGWGSSWFAGVVTPYLWSLFRLNPDIALVSAMPLMVKLHFTSAWLLIAVFPFTRLVHALVMPLMYLTRRTQVVRWYRQPTRRHSA